MKEKLVFISNIAAPIQVMFSDKLQKYYDAQFWFHEQLNKQRPDWWKIDLGEKCKVLSGVKFKKYGFYYSTSIIKQLDSFDPDIIILGGFKMITNYLAYRWAKKKKKIVIVFSETFRKKGKLRSKGFYSIFIQFLYKYIDGIMTSNQDAANQFLNIFKYFRNRIYASQYPSDIDNYFTHPVRKKKDGYVYLFPNRLTDDYNPLLAIKIFHEIYKKDKGSVLKLNRMGELYGKCCSLIEELGINDNVIFLENIKSWNEMHLIYKECDILIFPAKFSNGNFSIIESMASGMGIVISSRILWNSSMIKNGVNGYVCEPELNDFVKCIAEYQNDPKLFEKHCHYNREITKKYTAEETAVLFKKTIDEIIVNRKY